MTVIETLFAELRARHEKALMPFIAAGDPNLAVTQRLLQAFRDTGCHLCELGFPYSDPIADGPTIQSAFTRALAAGIKVDDIFRALASAGNPLPTVAMLSYAIVHRIGIEPFVHRAVDAGFCGLIVPDLPGEESETLASICRRQGLDLVQLITPTTRPERARRILDAATGFVYYVSVAGVTGQRTQLPESIVDNLAQLREWTPLPICVGFGISRPEHARQLAPHCDGIIVGSAIVRRIEEGVAAGKTTDEMLSDVQDLCSSLLAGLSTAT